MVRQNGENTEMTVKELNSLTDAMTPKIEQIIRKPLHDLRNDLSNKLLAQDEDAARQFAEINAKLDKLGDGKTVRALIKYGAWIIVGVLGFFLKGKIEWPTKN